MILETDGTVVRVTAWARGVTDTFRLDDPENTAAPRVTGGRGGTRGMREGD